MDDEIGVAQEFDVRDVAALGFVGMAFAGVRAVRFVIGRVDDARAVRFQPIADGERGVVEILRGDAHVADREPALDHFVKMHVRGERVQRDREVGIIHLPGEHVAQRLAEAARAVDVPLVARDEERREERQTLNVIPVRVRDQDVAALRGLFYQRFPSACAGARIDEMSRRVVASTHDVAAIARAAWRRDRSARPQKRTTSPLLNAALCAQRASSLRDDPVFAAMRR